MRLDRRFRASAFIAVVIILFTGCRTPTQVEVSFHNSETTLNGTLYIPTGRGPHPAIVLVGGSGRSPRDNLRWYADLFAYHGVAGLVYDKRDIGQTPGTELVSGEQLAGDVIAGVEMLREREDIDPKRIGLWGGSQGSGVAARAAASSQDIAFMISMSGGGVDYEELSAYQFANRMRDRGFSEDDIREALAAVSRVYTYVRTRNDAKGTQAALDSAWQKPWAPLVFAYRRIPTDEEMRTWTQWREIERSPTYDWERVRIPVLAFWGEADEVVPVDASMSRIREALKKAGNNDVTMIVVPGADHNLMRHPNPENMPAQDYLDTMLKWVAEKTRPEAQ